jgi:hypothetical protein
VSSVSICRRFREKYEQNIDSRLLRPPFLHENANSSIENLRVLAKNVAVPGRNVGVPVWNCRTPGWDFGIWALECGGSEWGLGEAKRELVEVKAERFGAGRRSFGLDRK